jgi:Phospholipase_D-nuclease N-terminal
MVLALSDFWSWFFLLLIWVPLVMLWATALVDIFRRHDLSGGLKVLWVLIIFLIPWLGVLIYLFTRPRVLPAT